MINQATVQQCVTSVAPHFGVCTFLWSKFDYSIFILWHVISLLARWLVTHNQQWRNQTYEHCIQCWWQYITNCKIKSLNAVMYVSNKHSTQLAEKESAWYWRKKGKTLYWSATYMGLWAMFFVWQAKSNETARKQECNNYWHTQDWFWNKRCGIGGYTIMATAIITHFYLSTPYTLQLFIITSFILDVDIDVLSHVASGHLHLQTVIAR